MGAERTPRGFRINDTPSARVIVARDRIARAWSAVLGPHAALERANALMTGLAHAPNENAAEHARAALDIGDRAALYGISGLTRAGIDELAAVAAAIWREERGTP